MMRPPRRRRLPAIGYGVIDNGSENLQHLTEGQRSKVIGFQWFMVGAVGIEPATVPEGNVSRFRWPLR